MKKLSVKQCRYLKYLLGNIRERISKGTTLNSYDFERLVKDLNVVEDLVRQEIDGDELPVEQDWNQTVSEEIKRAVALRKKGP